MDTTNYRDCAWRCPVAVHDGLARYCFTQRSHQSDSFPSLPFTDPKHQSADHDWTHDHSYARQVTVVAPSASDWGGSRRRGWTERSLKIQSKTIGPFTAILVWWNLHVRWRSKHTTIIWLAACKVLYVGYWFRAVVLASGSIDALRGEPATDRFAGDAGAVLFRTRWQIHGTHRGQLAHRFATYS